MADKNSRITLGIALVTGVLALLMSLVYLRGERKKPAAQQKRAEPQVEVLRAREDLPADHSLDPEQDLERVTVPAETFESFARGAVKAEDAYAVAGRRVYHPIAGGTVLQYGDLVPVKDLDITPGMVGMCINVDEASLMGGLLVPGDLVDIVVTRPVPQAKPAAPPAAGPPTGATGEAAAEHVMQQVMQSMLSIAQEPATYKASKVLSSVRVLSVGGRLTRSREQLLFGPGMPGSSGSVVMLEVTSEDALLLREQMAGQGQVSLLLLPKHVSTAPTGTILEN